jgi:hypothetical protein
MLTFKHCFETQLGLSCQLIFLGSIISVTVNNIWAYWASTLVGFISGSLVSYPRRYFFIALPHSYLIFDPEVLECNFGWLCWPVSSLRESPINRTGGREIGRAPNHCASWYLVPIAGQNCAASTKLLARVYQVLMEIDINIVTPPGH